MFDINVIEDTSKFIKISWVKNYSADYYIIEAKNDFFNYEIISETNDNNYLLEKELISKYYAFKVSAIKVVDEEIKIISESKEEDFKKIEVKRNIHAIISLIDVRCIESYNGVTFSLNTNIMCDVYRLFELNDNKKKLLLETTDFQFSYNDYSLDKEYVIEGYKKINDSLEKICRTSKFKIEFYNINKEHDKLSICIPTYNAEVFIPRTLDSVLASDFNGYKIIICNDGSKDNTKEVCNWYKEKYNFIEFIDKENTGVSDTRNVLLDHVDTPYMAYIDADDYFTNNMFSKLYEAITKENADVAISKTIIRDEKDDRRKVLLVDCKDKGYKTYTYEEMFWENEKNSYDNIYFVAVWNKIVKTDVARKVKFPESNYYEDSAYTPALYSYANKFVIVDKTYYIWDKRKRLTHGTYSTSYKEKSFEEIVEYYGDAILYPIRVCSEDKSLFVQLNCMKLLIKYYENIKDNKDKVVLDYIDKLKNIIKEKDMLNNKYIKENKELFDKLNNL